MLTQTRLLSLAFAALLGSCAPGPSTSDASKDVVSSPAEPAPPPSTDKSVGEATASVPQFPLWGDTHVHTSNSFDTYLFGTVTATPDTAYRFARGQEVVSPTTGTPWKLSRPLDFLVVADHAEIMGSVNRVYDGQQGYADTQTGEFLRSLADGSDKKELIKPYLWLQTIGSGQGSADDIPLPQVYADLQGGEKRRSVWTDTIEAAERNNLPGEFTAFIGWEWTSQPDGANLHRVVFTPAGETVANQWIPFSSLEGPKPEQLWAWLDATSKATGADFVAIPHNSNISMERMFDIEDSDGNPIGADYAEQRMRWERVVEATQIKGDSEAHPMLSPTDELAGYEKYNFVMTPSALTPDPEVGDYVRSALKRGLEIEAETGVNPYKFGMIGSTDSHTGMSAVEETAFAGKNQKDAVPTIRSNPTGLGGARGWDMGAAGLVASWAPENTRDSIFASFKRREVYATTGTRITLRFFAGADIDAADLSEDSFPTAAYRDGVSMGGEVSGPVAPNFLVYALKDADGANLDRVQIIKGWIDEGGAAQEKVYDIVWSGDRQKNAAGKLSAVGNTVDLTSGAYTNTIGETQLSAVWSDPDFNPSQNAFYYARAIEIPTPRYSLLDALSLGIDISETGRPATIQERAYSSPIWYQPE